MDKFENSIIKGIHVSRYIASWVKCGYPIHWCSRPRHEKDMFMAWLETLVINGERLTEEEIWTIHDFALEGKYELEVSATTFMRDKGFG